MAAHKVKKDVLDMVVEMEPVIDVLATMGKRKTSQFIVGLRPRQTTSKFMVVESWKRKTRITSSRTKLVSKVRASRQTTTRSFFSDAMVHAKRWVQPVSVHWGPRWSRSFK